MKVYLVEDCCFAPGRILAVFANEEDANRFAEALDYDACVKERTLFYGQPPAPGYNK